MFLTLVKTGAVGRALSATGMSTLSYWRSRQGTIDHRHDLVVLNLPSTPVKSLDPLSAKRRHHLIVLNLPEYPSKRGSRQVAWLKA